MGDAAMVSETPCTCAMLRRTTRRVTQFYDYALRPSGLRLTQYSLLANINRADGLCITDLAERLAMERTTLTRNLRPLEQAGWIRVAAGANRRQRAVHITPEGSTKFEQAKPLWKAAESMFREQIGRTDTEALRGLLDDVLARTPAH